MFSVLNADRLMKVRAMTAHETAGSTVRYRFEMQGESRMSQEARRGRIILEIHPVGRICQSEVSARLQTATGVMEREQKVSYEQMTLGVQKSEALNHVAFCTRPG